MAVCSDLPNGTINRRLIDQIIRSGTSVGANYREANEKLSKKDFFLRIKISRKEAKETSYWLELLMEGNVSHKLKLQQLLQETYELRNILSKILSNSQ